MRLQTVTKTTEVFTLDELSDRAKQRAMDTIAEFNVDYEWWDCIYEDASQVGIKINSFDLDRNRHACTTILDCKETAYLIVYNHGPDCETYKTASRFIADYDAIVDAYPSSQERTSEQDRKIDNQLDRLEDEFRESITEDYSIILQHEYEYRTSEEAIGETIEANNYEFTADGKLI